MTHRENLKGLARLELQNSKDLRLELRMVYQIQILKALENKLTPRRNPDYYQAYQVRTSFQILVLVLRPEDN